MLTTVSEVSFMTNDWAMDLDRTLDVINLPNVQGAPTSLNVLVKVTGPNPPASIKVALNTFEPISGLKGRGSMTPMALREVELPRVNMPLPPNVTAYRKSLPELARSLMKVDEGKEVATVARLGGTSDAYFRKPLLDKGWRSRGVAVQALNPAQDVGNEAKKQPSALRLFESGGVEGIEAEVKPQPGLVVGPSGKTWGFVRSPAGVFYYSGHGAFWDGALIEPDHTDWLTPESLLSYWHKTTKTTLGPMNIDCLIIAGCSVLYIDFDNPNNRYSQGRKWAKLLCTNIDGGSLRVLLGYGAGKEVYPSTRGGKAPVDSDDKGHTWGNTIAQKMAEAMASGISDRDYAKKWIEVNRNAGIYTAIAIDVWDGYRDAIHPNQTRKL